MSCVQLKNADFQQTLLKPIQNKGGVGVGVLPNLWFFKFI